MITDKKIKKWTFNFLIILSILILIFAGYKFISGKPSITGQAIKKIDLENNTATLENRKLENISDNSDQDFVNLDNSNSTDPIEPNNNRSNRDIGPINSKSTKSISKSSRRINEPGPSSELSNISLETPIDPNVNTSNLSSGLETDKGYIKHIFWKNASYNKFNGDTTNFNLVENIEKINYPIIHHVGYGKIQWKSTNFNVSGIDFDSLISFRYNFISVNSKNLSYQFNSSANLTLFNLDYEFVPVIYRDDEICKDCSFISYNNGNFMFNVNRFSSYTSGDNSQLHLWDETDNGFPYANMIKHDGDNVNYYANYSNVTSGISISSANCQISFDGSWDNMIYNSSKQLFEYNVTSGAPGTIQFNVSCDGSASGFEILDNLDYSSVSAYDGPVSFNITDLESSRGMDSSLDSLVAGQGNVTSLNLNMSLITRSWQGFYGNITGKITLESAALNILYDWDMVTPTGEIYAARASDVNFASVACSDASEITSEETFIGHVSTDADSVSNTFNLNSHPEFNVGSITLSENSCKSTNTNVDGLPQNSDYYEVLLSDSASNLVYTTIMDANKIGFDTNNYDFQMLVGEDGHNGDSTLTTYYFFMEIG